MAGNGTDDQLDREGIPDLEPPINQDEGIIAPGDQPIAADEFGVTAAEARAEEPIAERVTREVADTSPDDLDVDAILDEDGIGDALDGRLVEPGSEDVDVLDDEKDVVGTLVGEDDGALTAEESAMHITDAP